VGGGGYRSEITDSSCLISYYRPINVEGGEANFFDITAEIRAVDGSDDPCINRTTIIRYAQNT
jgi:hypothetical protein